MTKSRWVVLAFLFVISVITYVDRVNMSVAGAAISREFSFSKIQLGTIFSAFIVGYALFQVVGGWLGDKIGHKRVLAAALIWWSAFTALTAWVGSSFLVSFIGAIPTFWCVRFLIGVGEAAAYPCSIGLIKNWFPSHERGRATGIFFTGVGVGTAITPPLTAWMMINFGWQSAFYAAGALGILFAIVFYIAIPEQQTQRTEVATIQQGHWRRLLKNKQLWLLTVTSFWGGYVIYIFFFWFYLYLVNVRGFDLLRGSFFASLPFVAMIFGSSIGGIFVDRWSVHLGKIRARRRAAVTSLLLAAVLVYFGAFTESAYWAIAALALAAGFISVLPGCVWATSIEIEPSRPATGIGLTNTGANLGGAISPILTPWIAEHYGWNSALVIASFALLTAAFLWRFIGVEEAELTKSTVNFDTPNEKDNPLPLVSTIRNSKSR